jgi:hypothetical protein
VKRYDKAYTPKGSVLCAEATVHNADDFRVCRRKEGDRKGPRAWRRLRRGIVNAFEKFSHASPRERNRRCSCRTLDKAFAVAMCVEDGNS